MFETELKDMTATIFLSPTEHNIVTAQNVGISNEMVFANWHKYSFCEAVKIIKAFDRAIASCPKYLVKKVKAARNSFLFAFGPDMESYIKEVSQ